MEKRTNLLLAIFGGSLFLACGDDVTKVTQVTQEISGLEVVASADSLGKCSSEISGEMKFARKENAVYVCADSAWQNVSEAGKDGSDGKDGTSCTVELLADSSGYKVICGGDSVGVVFNGKDGKKGEAGKDGVDGSDGENGKDGAGCTITDNGDGSVTQVCGMDSVTLYKAFCGNKPFDPDSSFCYNERIYGYFFEDTRDGQVYRTVRIGEQIWMAENLNYAYMPDTLSSCYDDNLEYCDKYGRLYTWSAAMDSAALFSEGGKDCGNKRLCSASGRIRGVCPAGWHLPDSTEWSTLNNFVAEQIGGVDSVGYALKSTSGWNDNEGVSGNGSDAFGFGALPAGNRLSVTGKSFGMLEGLSFWSSTESYEGAYYAYSLELFYENARLFMFRGDKNYPQSIRCVKD